MRIWIDLTNSPHVLVMRPLIGRLRAAGHAVDVTARDYAQTLGLLERLEIEHVAIGRHRGQRVAAKGAGLLERSLALARWARPRRFDVALGHGSNDVSVAARLLRIPSATMFDYEWAKVQHSINCRLAAAVVVPDVIPAALLARYGARGKLRPYAGLKEEYYLADFEPDRTVLEELALDSARPLIVVRTPPEVSLYHPARDDVFSALLLRLRDAAADGVQTVVLPRIASQRAQLAAARGLLVPERAVDAQSLVAFADAVVSAGGTMNREAAALGTPAWTTFTGRPGAVDDELIAQGRLRRLTDARELPLGRRAAGAAHPGRVRRDPQVLVDLLLSAVPRR